jgi:putative SOS response-associated peptidase YedK
MCGRYVSPAESDLERFWDVRRGTRRNFPAQFNVAPTMQVPIVYADRHDGARTLDLVRWGLVPFWAKDKPKPPPSTFNARLEDAATKPMWRQSFRTARCIVPATGWYEWRERQRIDRATGEVTKYKQPYFLHLPGNRPIGLAGLMSWTKPEGSDEWVGSCAILTAPATGAAADVHDRMPVALEESAHDAWIDRGLVDPDQVQKLIADHRLASVELHPVSTRVNASRDDDPSLIEPVPLPPA